MSAVPLPKIRTNVRIQRDPLRIPRNTLRALGAVSDDLAALYAEHLFLTPPKPARPAWELEVLAGSERGEVVSEDGDRIPTWSWGEGPVVLLVHGWSGRGSQLGALVAPLVAAGFRVVTFDGPGHGDAPARQGSVVTQARAVTAVSRSVRQVHAIVAHSVGGTASMLAAHWAPEGAAPRYVLVGAPLDPKRFLADFSRMLGVSPIVLAKMIARVEARYGIDVAELDTRIAAATLRASALIIHDEKDGEVDVASGRELAALWPGSRLKVTDGLGHRRILRDPDVLDDVVEFVGGNAPRRGLRVGTLEGDLYFRGMRV